MSSIAIIGGGIAGLFSGTLLALRGYDVTIFEKNESPGGKLWSYSEAGYHFDYGPSTLTMPWLFEALAKEVGGDALRMLPYQRLSVLHRSVFDDGVTLDAVSDPHEMTAQICALDASDGQHWASFLADSKRLYNLATTQFFTRTFSRPSEFISWPLLRAVLATRPWQSLHAYHARFFQDSRILMMLDRYATYVGSSPYRTPATLGLIAHLEYDTGVYYLAGGTAQLIAALVYMAERAGARILTGASVTRIIARHHQVRGVEVAKEPFAFDHVLAATDSGYAVRQLLNRDDQPKHLAHRHAHAEQSHAGFVLLLGVAKTFPQLAHHTVFYPRDYRQEFYHLFDHQTLNPDPTIYVCYTGHTEVRQAPDGATNLFVLINTPSFASDLPPDAWDQYEDHVLSLLEDRCGLSGLRAALRVRRRITPADLAQRTNTPAGAIYGLSSNGLHAALIRPPMTIKGLKGLTFTGGTTHPGGGTPMVAISARLAADLIATQSHTPKYATGRAPHP